MRSYIITVKPETSDSELAQMKKGIEAQGGQITEEYTILRGFACKIPDDKYSALASHPHMQSMEPDGAVTTC